MNINYRQANLSDTSGMALLRTNQQASETYWDNRIAAYMRNEHHPQKALSHRIIYVAVCDNLIVGFIAGHLTQRFDFDGELQWIDVLHTHQNRGIAGNLWRHLVKWFLQQNAKKICVNASPDNTAALAFYRKYGARPLNEHWLEWGNIETLSY